MEQKEVYAVIMAGGRGERFWPLSTTRRPKQLLSIIGGKPLVTMAVERLKGFIPSSRIFIITTDDIAGEVRKAVRSIPRENVIGEPFGRDTAAAVALASALVGKRSPDAVFCVLTADQVMSDIAVFQETLEASFEIASRENVLITIGIKPTHAATGYGYIEAGKRSSMSKTVEFFKARRFVEKPDGKTAERYVRSGKYFWNSGMFVWSVAAIRKALLEHRPQLHEMASRIEQVVDTPRFVKALANEYLRLDKISIDYAVMEKSRNILMVKGEFRWDDVGTWAALENHFQKDRTGNVTVGKVETLDSSGNIVVSQDRLVAMVGVRDLVVIQSADATLVCSKSKAQDVKKLVSLLKEKRRYGELL